MTWTLRDQAKQQNSPPLQGRGRGWGLSAGRMADLAGYARDMRCEPTEPEKRLWRVLSRSQLGGFKFRRQAVIGPFIADFLCAQRALIVEVDGETHEAVSDAKRDAVLGKLGFSVVHVTNREVMSNLDGVLSLIRIALQRASDRWDRPHPNPSPEGEGLFSASIGNIMGLSLEGSVR